MPQTEGLWRGKIASCYEVLWKHRRFHKIFSHVNIFTDFDIFHFLCRQCLAILNIGMPFLQHESLSLFEQFYAHLESILYIWMTCFSSAENTQPRSSKGFYSTFWLVFCSYEPILYNIGMTFLSFTETHNHGVLKGFNFTFGAVVCSCDPCCIWD